eukprot:m.286593 g.286593  ORF g.286593 m.286593 type:complete len:602 (-) comp17778_c0_seq38:48-1853(-)
MQRLCLTYLSSACFGSRWNFELKYIFKCQAGCASLLATISSKLLYHHFAIVRSQNHVALIVGDAKTLALVNVCVTVCTMCGQPVDDVYKKHQIWLDTGPDSNGIAVGMTCSLIYHLYAKLLKGHPQGFEEIREDILTRLAVPDGGRCPTWCGQSCSLITATKLKKLYVTGLSATLYHRHGYSCLSQHEDGYIPAVGCDGTPTTLPPSVLTHCVPVDEPDSLDTTVPRFPLNRNARALVSDSSARKKLRECNTINRADVIATVTETRSELKKNSKDPANEHLIAAMDQLLLLETSDWKSHPEFLAYIGAESSVTTWMNPVQHEKLKPFCVVFDIQTPEAWLCHETEQMVHECFPELLDVVRSPSLHWRIAAIRVIFAFVLRASVVVAAINEHSQTFQVPDSGHRTLDVRRYAGASLLGRSSQRPVPRFEKDGQSTASQDDQEDGPCQKQYGKQRCMLVLHICLQHGTICSFHLTHAEGRKDVILPIYREWSKMPELIVYDFACGASEYVLNRFPKLFANTRFCHDKFHQMTHTRCGAALRLDRKGGRAYNYNSSIMEQKNAIFRGLDKTLSNAKLDYALFLIQAVVTGLNEIQACTGADTET